LPKIGLLGGEVGAKSTSGESSSTDSVTAPEHSRAYSDSAGPRYLSARVLTEADLVNTAYSKQTPSDQAGTNPDLNAHLRRLGQLVDAEFREHLEDAEGQPVSGRYKAYTPSPGAALGLIEVAMNAQNPNGTLAHEDWHAVEDLLREMGPAGQKLLNIVRKASSRPFFIRWLAARLVERGELADSEALKQLENDPAERAAYAFQFYFEAGGKLPLAPEARGFFEKLKALLKRVFGITDELIKTGRIFELFEAGAFVQAHKDPGALVEALGETRREKFVENMTHALEPLREIAFKAFGYAADRVHAMNNPVYSEIVRRLSEGDGESAGYAREQKARTYQFINEWVRGTTRPAFIARVEAYMKAAGIDRLAPEDLPIVVDSTKIEGRLHEFEKDLRDYGGLGPLSGAAFDRAVNQIMEHGYAHGVLELFKDAPSIGAKWANEDVNARVFGYVEHSTKLAEEFRAFGAEGIEGWLTRGGRQASFEERGVMATYVDAALGRAHLALSPHVRALFGTMITAVNLSLLPFSLFSQLVEPLQLAFRRNSLENVAGDAWRGLTELRRVKGGAERDVWDHVARTMGIVTDAQAVSMMSEIMNEIPLRRRLNLVNRHFFRLNGMEQWNRAMHVAATRHAFEFIAQHAAGKDAEGAALLAEIGLKRGEIPTLSGGVPDYQDKRVRAAILRFVNEAMAQPSAASNTMWMNDPRFALVAHLKRFTFGFSYYINRRAWRLIKQRQFRPLLPLMLMAPMAVATTGLRDLATPASEGYKANWGVSDYALNGIERTGLAGRASIVNDVLRNIDYGGSGIEALAPTAEMASKAVRQVATGT
jgi:hypothetical protein